MRDKTLRGGWAMGDQLYGRNYWIIGASTCNHIWICVLRWTDFEILYWYSNHEWYEFDV